jgi:sirohydrochlorin cobaltochelatase
MMGRTGVMICGHGSREAETVHEFTTLVRDVALRLPQYQVDSGFLEFAAPDIRDGLEKLRMAGCGKILVIPGTLFSGGHATHDIPSILRNYAAQFPEIEIRYGQAFDVDKQFIDAACARVSDAINAASGWMDPGETAMLVVGRGASDPEVLASVRTIMRHIHISFNFAHTDAAFSGIAPPLFSRALERVADHAFRRVIVLPYFLFTGKLVKRIYDETDAISAQYPQTQFIKASYLNNHPRIIDGFVARIIATGTTGTRMNA